VLSPASYNAKSGLCLVCSVTSQAKGNYFEIAVSHGLNVQGVILSDHIKSADWRQRKADYIGSVPSEILQQVHARLRPLLSM
jgi:mRNA interferase MazF